MELHPPHTTPSTVELVEPAAGVVLCRGRDTVPSADYAAGIALKFLDDLVWVTRRGVAAGAIASRPIGRRL